MSRQITAGGPAFPLADSNAEYDRTDREHCNGMTLRDYFAAKAMQGELAASAGAQQPSPDATAEYAYRMADAMLAARGKAE